jgi:hypothetical protein
MFPRVAEHVLEGMADLARRAENAVVIAIGEHFAASTEGAVDRARQSHRQALHRAREAARVPGLDDEVHVVALHGELDDARVEAIARPLQALHDPAKAARAAQVREPGEDFHGDEDRSRTAQRAARAVPDARSRSDRFAARSVARPAVLSEVDLRLSCSSRVHEEETSTTRAD